MSRVFGFIGAMFASMVRHWRFTLFTGVPLITAIYMLKLKPALDARNAISATLKSPNVSGAVKAHMAAEQSQMMSPIFLWIAILGGVIVGLALIAMLLNRRSIRKSKEQAKAKAEADPETAERASSDEMFSALSSLQREREELRQKVAKGEVRAKYAHLNSSCDCGNRTAVAAPWTVRFKDGKPYGIHVPAAFLERHKDQFSLVWLFRTLHAGTAPHVWKDPVSGPNCIEADPENGDVVIRLPR